MTIRSLAAIALVVLASSAPVQAADSDDPVPQIVQITVHGSGVFGSDVAMTTEVFKPEGDGPFPIVLYSHGRAGTDVERRQMKTPVLRGHVRYWLRKGFALVAPIRPGYGATGGTDREISGARYDAFGNCIGHPDFGVAAKGAVAATTAALEWVRAQPWADPHRILLVGTSMGGLTSVATAAANPAGVVGYINFAGGAGGDPARAPGRSCGADAMEALMRDFGKSTRVPGLWLYAENDLYWGSEAPRAWHAAFVQGGATSSEFVLTAAVPNADGHQLLARGGKLWSVHTDKFVKDLGF